MVVRQGPLQDLISGTLEAEVRVDAVTPALHQALTSRWQTLPVTPDAAVMPSQSVIRVALDDESELPAIADAVLRSGARLYALIPQQRTLEDLFIELVKTRET
jgi:ABC-2 type transport system ATP-binding protein